MTEQINITTILTSGGTQARAQLNRQTVMEYRQALEESNVQWPFPPVTIFHDGRNHWLADGFHRVKAADEHGHFTIPADIRQGTRRDAILYAAGANAQHGLRRTAEDKRRAVTYLLEDEEWRQWSDREIARRCHVSPTLVGTLRKELTVHVDSDGSRKYITKHGTTAAMQTGSIGQPKTKKPTAHVFYLERKTRDWLKFRTGSRDLAKHIAILQAIKNQQGNDFTNLTASINRENEVVFRPGNLRQACLNVLDQMQKKVAEDSKAQPSVPLSAELDKIDVNLAAEINEMLGDDCQTAVTFLRSFTDEHDRTWRDMTREQAVREFKAARPQASKPATQVKQTLTLLWQEVRQHRIEELNGIIRDVEKIQFQEPDETAVFALNQICQSIYSAIDIYKGVVK